MTVLLTGAAGFIGYHVALALLARGRQVLGVDNLNPYYDPALKQARLERLQARPGFSFERLDVADRAGMEALGRRRGREIEGVVHLAAQAGVRHSLSAPFDYVQSNLVGHMVVLELCRHAMPNLRHLVYASSSSVYGGNRKTPFSVEDRVDRPISLYAATKRADELMSHAYAHLFALPQTGLRFFTVYGPWGRPDMAAFLFADAITAGRPITLFNHGRMERDFTYVDDIVGGVLAALDRPPPAGLGEAPHRVYNLGNNRPVALLDFVALIERALGVEAVKELAPMQPGDVAATSADIEASRRDLGYAPTVPIEEGIARFIAWYREWRSSRRTEQGLLDGS
jgi:UDP-glucuronate 4-epimerase